MMNYKQWIYDCWNAVMDHEQNPLSDIKHLPTRHLVMQILSWMWCSIFAVSLGSMTVFGVTMIAHVLIVGGIAVTVGTFETARRRPQYFGGLGRGIGGEHE